MLPAICGFLAPSSAFAPLASASSALEAWSVHARCADGGSRRGSLALVAASGDGFGNACHGRRRVGRCRGRPAPATGCRPRGTAAELGPSRPGGGLAAGRGDGGVDGTRVHAQNHSGDVGRTGPERRNERLRGYGRGSVPGALAVRDAGPGDGRGRGSGRRLGVVDHRRAAPFADCRCHRLAVEAR